MTPEALRDEILRSSLKFLKANGLNEKSVKSIYGALWEADERIGELTAKKMNK